MSENTAVSTNITLLEISTSITMIWRPLTNQSTHLHLLDTHAECCNIREKCSDWRQMLAGMPYGNDWNRRQVLPWCSDRLLNSQTFYIIVNIYKPGHGSRSASDGL